jgi:hypothetical protein
LVLVLVWSRLLVQVCWSVPLSSVGQQPLSSMGNNPCPLWDSNSCPMWATTPVLCGIATLVLCGTTTHVLYGTAPLVLCGTTTLVLCGTYHPLWLPFHLIGWFALFIRFWDESLWFLVKVARQPFGSCGLCGSPRSRPL